MRTTLEIERKLLDEVTRATGEKSVSKAVSQVLESYLYQRAVSRLEEVAGTIDFDDNWQAMERLEVAQLKRDQGPGG